MVIALSYPAEGANIFLPCSFFANDFLGLLNCSEVLGVSTKVLIWNERRALR
jgi:hypothetical protein